MVVFLDTIHTDRHPAFDFQFFKEILQCRAFY